MYYAAHKVSFIYFGNVPFFSKRPVVRMVGEAGLEPEKTIILAMVKLMPVTHTAILTMI
jgi:hypothetical protein